MCDNVVCARVVCDNVVCERVVCDNAVCDNVVDGTKYQSARSCHQVKRLPCHKKRTFMSPSARLPRKVHVHVTKCHACYATSCGVKRAQAGPSAPPEP